MSKTSRRMNKEIRKLIEEYIKETDQDKAQDLMKQIRKLAKNQKMLEELEEPYRRGIILTEGMKLIKKFKNRKEQEKEILEKVLREEVEEPVKKTEKS